MGLRGDQPFPPHPYFAFVDLKIGTFDFTPIPPEHLINFDVTFEGDSEDSGIGQGSFTVFDETALRIEHALLVASENAGGLIPCFFNFGYVETPHISETYSYLINDYSLSIKAGGSELTIKIISTGIKSHGLPRTLAYNTGGSDFKSLNEIIEDIAEKSDWEIISIQDIEDIIVEGDDNNGLPIYKPIEVRIDNIPTTTGMFHKVLSICRGEDGDTSVVLTFVDEGSDGKVKVIISSFGYSAAEGSPVKEYSIAWDGTLGEVINFTPEFSGASMLTGGATVDVSAYDEGTMTPIVEDHDAFTVPGKYLIGGRETHITPDSAYLIPNYSSGMRDVLKAKANYLHAKSAQMKLHYKASMEILGDPYLKVRDLIDVIVRTPSGIPHHTSGTYLIEQITHTISGGAWKTSLNLIRNPSESILEIVGRVIGEDKNMPLDPSQPAPNVYQPNPHGWKAEV